MRNVLTYHKQLTRKLHGAVAGLLALLVDLESLAQLVSIGTLAVFFCVCLGCLRRRYYEPGKNAMAPFVWRCIIMTLFNIGAHSHIHWAYAYVFVVTSFGK